MSDLLANNKCRSHTSNVLPQNVKMPQKLPNWKVHQIRIALEAKMPIANIAKKAQVKKNV
jgi:hypothetical protein